MKSITLIISFSFCLLCFSQTDSLTDVYLDKIIIYGDLGYNSYPFDIKINNVESFKFRNNIKPFIGVGMNYKWISVRLGTLINYHLKGLENYGKTKIFKLSSDIIYKRYLVELNYYNFSGYTLLKNDKHVLSNNKMEDLSLHKASVNTCFFINKLFNYNSLKGVKRSVKKNNYSFYLKNTNSFLDIDYTSQILPLTDEVEIKFTDNFDRLKFYEFGLLSGLAIASRVLENFQVGTMIGLGGVYNNHSVFNLNQIKKRTDFYARYEFHFFIGYNVKKFFIMNYLDFEPRQISLPNVQINSNLISYRFVTGYRF
jgi:hypothetical protein